MGWGKKERLKTEGGEERKKKKGGEQENSGNQKLKRFYLQQICVDVAICSLA